MDCTHSSSIRTSRFFFRFDLMIHTMSLSLLESHFSIIFFPFSGWAVTATLQQYPIPLHSVFEFITAPVLHIAHELHNNISFCYYYPIHRSGSLFPLTLFFNLTSGYPIWSPPGYARVFQDLAACLRQHQNLTIVIPVPTSDLLGIREIFRTPKKDDYPDERYEETFDEYKALPPGL